MYPNHLAAKVAAVNLANQTANETYPILRDIFAPLVGQTINKKDGTLLAKIAKLLPAFPYSSRLHVYKYDSDYSLLWVAQACETFPSSYDTEIACYQEASIYVGNVRDGILTSLCDAPNLRTDYKIEDVLRAREKYADAKKIADELYSALSPFGEYDR